MTYRGVYRDGVVVLQGDVDLQDGEAVDVNPTNPSRIKRSKKKATKKSDGSLPAKSRASLKKSSTKRPLPGFGAWKHRTDIVDTAEFARALRRKTSSRKFAD